MHTLYTHRHSNILALDMNTMIFYRVGSEQRVYTHRALINIVAVMNYIIIIIAYIKLY